MTVEGHKQVSNCNEEEEDIYVKGLKHYDNKK